MSFDIVIKNGRILDGTDNPWFKGNVGVKDGKIIKISRVDIGKGERNIDAKDMMVVPGFINIHAHTEGTILTQNRCESSLKQGITTEMAGPNGASLYPIKEEMKKPLKERLGVEIDWLTLADWRRSLERKGIGINIAPLVGHENIRICVMYHTYDPSGWPYVVGKGGERITPTKEEMEEMKRLVAQAMEDGAFGLSTGLAFGPSSRYASNEEIAELCKVVARYGGIYHSDAREIPAVIEGFKELIKIAEMGGVPATRTIMKAYGEENWGTPIEAIRIMNRTRVRGIDITFDQYPWMYTNECNLGRWFLPIDSTNEIVHRNFKDKEELEKTLNDVKDDEKWERMKREQIERWERDRKATEETVRRLEKEGLGVGMKWWDPANYEYIVYSKTHPEIVGKNLQEVAEAMGIGDYLDAIRKVWIDDGGETYTCSGKMSEEDVIAIMKHPTTAITSDGFALDERPPAYDPQHPRSWGTYPRVLQWVREKRVLRLEDAIRKMTSLPAQIFQIRDRGLLREGMWADIVIFNPKTVKNNATYGNPCQSPDGIPYVLVNGKIVIDEGEHTGVLAGRVLFHKP